MESHILAAQAHVLKWVGLGMLILSLYLGINPLDAAWRAMLGALVAMIVVGWLLRQVATVFQERASADLAAMSAEQEAQELKQAQQTAKETAKEAAKDPKRAPPRPQRPMTP